MKKHIHTPEGLKEEDYSSEDNAQYVKDKEDYDKLNKICDWNFKFMTLPHSNKSKRAQKDYRKYYDDGSGLAKHLVSEIYREDIEIYGYTF